MESNIEILLAALFALILSIYLVYTIIRPEKF